MANTILTPSIIAKEAALQVVNNLAFARLANKQFKNDFNVKVGDTVTYRKPIRFTAVDGPVLTVQDVTENYDTVVINKRKHVGWEFNSKDLTLSIEEFAERYVRPAAITLANQIDADGAALYKNVYNSVGTAGTAPVFATLLNARQKQNEFSNPMNDRFFAVNPAGANSVMSNLTTVLQPSLIENITKEASIGRSAGYDMYESQNVISHTAGTATAANIAVAANPASGATSISLSLTVGTGTLVAGDVLTFSNAFAVNPIGKQVTGSATSNLQQFVVTADVSLSTTPATVNLSPSIISSGAYQTVSALPTTSSTVTKLATHTANLAWQRNAFSLVTVPIVAPDGVVWSETVEYQGIGIRFLRGFDLTNDVSIARLDVMYGWKATYPELACRVLG